MKSKVKQQGTQPTASSAVSLRELKEWLIGRTIVGVTRKDAILALEFDDKTHIIIYTETFAKGLPK